MTTMTHVDPEEIMAWLDGELHADQKSAVAMHVENCPACAAVAAQFRGMSEELAGWSVPDAPDGLEKTVTNAMRTTERRIGRGSWHWGRWSVGLGAVAALVLVATFAPQRPHRSDEVQLAKPQVSQQMLDGLESAPSADERRSRADGEGIPASAVVEPAPVGPMIARTAALTIRVKEADVARAALEAVLVRHKGYVAQLNVSGGEGSGREFHASVRIPAGDLDAAMKEMKALGQVESETQSGEEVTARHQDLEARLKNAREEEVRLQAILQQRTGRISDILEVEQEIAQVRGEIESMEAEQAALEHRVEFASVDLSLTEEYKAEFQTPDSVGTRMRNALVAGYGNARDSVLGLVLFIEQYGPAMMVWGIVLGGPFLWAWRRYRRAQASFLGK